MLFPKGTAPLAISKACFPQFTRARAVAGVPTPPFAPLGACTYYSVDGWFFTPGFHAYCLVFLPVDIRQKRAANACNGQNLQIWSEIEGLGLDTSFYSYDIIVKVVP